MKTATLNKTKYAELLAKTLPRVIHNDKEAAEFTDALLELEEIERPSREEQELTELLTTLIEQYEADNYPVRKSTPLELMHFLLDQRGLSAKDLWPLIGSKGITSEILSGKRGISVSIASKLGQFFNIDPSMFIDWKSFGATRGLRRSG